ncbi:MAG: UPF0182 family protein [Acidobacteria bacterium]|nr:UPF0182 family protein [Acidobacteriota bacterium]
MRRFNPWLVVFLSLLAIYLFFRFGADLWMDWYWYQEVGYTQVFVTVLRTQFLAATAIGLSVAAFIFVNARVAIHGRQFVVWQRKPGVVDLGEVSIAPSFLKRVAAAVSLFFGFLMGAAAGSDWEQWLRFLYAQPFGKSDPLLGYDIGFYIFKLPAYSVVLGYAFAAVILSLLASGGVYFLSGQFQVRGTLLLSPPARRHLLLLLSLLLLLLAFSNWLDLFHMMTSPAGLFTGPGYTDVHARMPLLRATAIILGILSVLVAIAAFTRVPYVVSGAVAIYILLLFAKIVYPSAVQKLLVAPNELARETAFILHNIHATREAFSLDKVDKRELAVEKVLSRQDIENNAATVRNVRLWDHGPLLDTFGQIQEIRTYYEFISVDNDRYSVDGRPQQIMLSARELSSESLPNRNWINEHLSFTHGFGLTLGPVNRVTPEGLPVLLVQDIPPRSMVPALEIERPQIYFGELTTNYVIANSRAGEFDYPAGEKNVYRNYDGNGGVAVNSFFRRLVFAAGLGSTDILLSGLITPESRVLYHRKLQDRIARVAPYLRLDRDPYMVISQGRLFWLQDAYTVSDRYPFSQQVEGVGNYIRNSVKAVVDAYHGTIRFYAADPSDVVLRTYEQIFPGLFRPMTELPEDLRTHLRYPEDIFSIQASVYSTYHMDQPQIFYNKEDQWEIPALAEGQRLQSMQPYYTIMKLPGEQREEFILMLPFNPRNKDNLAAWMAARSDGEAYGELVVYLFPKQRLVYGPKQINARINQDPEISRQISLWDQRGSDVILGTLLVIPIEETLVYVRPLYIRAENGKIPELKRVVVAYENRIAMEETLEQSLARLFDTEGVAPSREPQEAVPDARAAREEMGKQSPGSVRLIQEAAERYNRAMQAQRQGDWAAYGDEIRRLGEILQRLAKEREN